MKYGFVLALLVCSLGLSGCGSSANPSSTTQSTATSPQPAGSPSPQPAPAPAPPPPSPSPAPAPTPQPSPPPGPGVTVALPALSTTGTTAVTSPIHFQATATPNSNASVTGYVIYVDNQNVYQNFSTSLDTWVVVSAGNHNVYIDAWDSTGAKFTAPATQSNYAINVTGFTPVTPPANAVQISSIDQPATGYWTVDNSGGAGGQCSNGGSIGSFASSSDPNTSDPPASGVGQHFVLNSQCQYDDTLFYWKDPTPPTNADTNFLWDFWFYIPTTTQTNTIQALEFDLFEALPMSNGVQEFMFGSQCNYASNQWQLWLSNNGNLTWTNAASPCQFSTGTWHHATYFMQRVTPTGYPIIPATLDSSTDTNTYLRFGTVTIDGVTTYFGDVANSTAQSSWSPVLGVQHQLDSSASGITIDEYITQESVTMW